MIHNNLPISDLSSYEFDLYNFSKISVFYPPCIILHSFVSLYSRFHQDSSPCYIDSYLLYIYTLLMLKCHVTFKVPDKIEDLLYAIICLFQSSYYLND